MKKVPELEGRVLDDTSQLGYHAESSTTDLKYHTVGYTSQY